MPEKKKAPTILAIDTSCDDTSAAVLFGRKVLSNIISSQVDLHREFAGVVPMIAKRAHQERIEPVIAKALKQAHLKIENIDAFAVTYGPGLAIALEVGVNKAKELALKYKKPLYAVNHMEGHLLACLADSRKVKEKYNGVKLQFPVLGLLVSGGHTELVLMKGFGDYVLLGETYDDAAGEAYDKVAKMLKLGYPGGPIVDELAQKGNSDRFELPLPLANDNTLNFSFSGLKTACLYKLQKMEKEGEKDCLDDFCATFQKMVILHLTDKLEKALKKYPVKQVLLGGGVVSNISLRKAVRKLAKKYNAKALIPYSKSLCMDNAAMIGVAAYFTSLRGESVKDVRSLDRDPVLNFER